MRLKSVTILAAISLLALVAAHARPQQDQKEDKVIDDFVTTRGVIFETVKPAAKPSPSGRRRPSGGVASTRKPASGEAKQGGGAVGSADVAQKKNNPSAQTADVAETDGGGLPDGVQIIKTSTLPNLAFGYTIYLKDSSGALLPVPTSKTYRTGDTIALVLETNADGYLYVFNTENEKNPVMIYPHVQIRDGANDVRAHVRETYPDDPSLGFEFQDPPTNEQLYVVISRTPLDGVPTGEALKKFCAKNMANCEWRPTAAQWARIAAAALDRRVTEARSTQIAQADTQPVMPVALQRGIRVKREEPAPSILRVADSPAAKMLVTKIELAHK